MRAYSLQNCVMRLRTRNLSMVIGLVRFIRISCGRGLSVISDQQVVKYMMNNK